ncbi:PTS sugar transporter subunit IIC [Lactococcus formosensis]|jgi:PTS system cellobiose-specific IIC component|uniref:PTS sugar transporter subunit IIC n=1 Tax=Lactococcus formosensis TaxID=1281486 RepID=UPI000309D5CE|nr:PTS sugar transporter subunit IIC [Lactococcus formosensis]MCH1723104.1 PTS sugar transporter subunit IIC [Lactococcus formosensis]MDG6112829.1 PTS sugar transporter subunit IIC [Lactococcus formosensis]MDG6115161.1 PTS sugar transporter subunit IIC [Lactococcus formosensis]MDG6121312.1 PTS sugar transporter subunit IIC [Lactococcus formosensis]MDG6124303.1 PTS sugar transporter subunit IIC [Lactococcus formosensis]
MNGFINEKILPPMLKFLNTRPMASLKNGMIYPLPFVIIGSIFLILGQLPIPAAQEYLFSIGLGQLFLQINNASFGIMALIAAFGIAYSWVKEEGYEGASAGLTAIIIHILMQPDVIKNVVSIADPTQVSDAWQVSGIINRTWLGGQGMILSIIVGLTVGWLYTAMLRKNITIKMPEQVPSNVADSFTALIPSGFLIALFGVLHGIFTIGFNTTMVEWVYKMIQIPLQNMVDSPAAIFIMGFTGVFLWWFGVHGTSIVSGIFGPLLLANGEENAALAKAGELTIENGANIVTAAFLDQFMTVTGAGMTIGLVIFLLVGAKSAQAKSLGKMSAGPALFNINEPIVFGLPIVLNPILAIPFMLTPLISGVLLYILISVGILPPFNGAYVPWTTPPIISGFLVGGWKTALWQAIMLVVTVFIYWPFAKKYDNILFEQEAEAKNEN